MLKLSPRMQMAADMVRRSKVVCDVGTDHAYLPSYLVLNKICPLAVACDIGSGPLLNAEKTVEAFGLTDKIKLVLSDGLNEINSEDADDFVFCGMGGLLIAELISRAQWLKSPEKHIICQPMTHIEDVRRYFIENGFEIEKESVCSDSGHVYTAISAYYTGEQKDYEPGFIYYGLLPQINSEESKQFVFKKAESMKKRMAGIEGREENKEEYENLKSALSDIERKFHYAEC